jgi:hypothetical protein
MTTYDMTEYRTAIRFIRGQIEAATDALTSNEAGVGAVEIADNGNVTFTLIEMVDTGEPFEPDFELQQRALNIDATNVKDFVRAASECAALRKQLNDTRATGDRRDLRTFQRLHDERLAVIETQIKSLIEKA